MTWLRVFLSRLVSRYRRDRWEADLNDELRFHLQMEIDRNIERGMAPDEARHEAMRGFGGLESTKETYRDQKGLPVLEMLVQDVRYSLRLLTKDRAFTIVAVLTLALGIGANTAIFSVVNGVLLEPLPFDGADRIVTVWEDFSAQGGPEQEWIEVPNFFEWKAETNLFETMVAFGSRGTNLTGRGEAQQLTEFGVSYDFLATFAIAPVVGRDFGPADDEPGAAPVAILSDGFWQREFNGDASVVDQALQLNGVSTTVVGIAPPEFVVPGTPPADLWTPLRLDPATATRNNFFLQGLARLQPGVSIEQAEARLDAMMEQIGAQFPENRGVTIALVPLLEQLVSPVRSGLYVLLGVVVFVLLIACANIANLLLGRGAARARELAIRSAMGAGRRRLVRQLLTESLMLSLAGATVGLLLAGWGTQALLSRVPAGAAPRLDNVGIDGTVLGFTVVIAIAAGLVFGLAPVVQFYRRDVNDTLKEGGRGRETSGGTRLRGALAAGQIALALGLLIASGLATRSFVSLMNVDPGFDPEGITTAFVSMPSTSYAGAPEQVTFLDSLVERVAARPGVESVAAISVLPLAGSDSDTAFDIEGRPAPDSPGSQPIVWYRRVTPDYFSTMRQPLLRGREFNETDRTGAPPVVLISDVTAERFWPGEDALGKRVRFGDGNPWHEIVGITQGVRHNGLSQEPRPELYFPYAQRPGRSMTLVVKSAADEAAVADLLRADLREVDASLPLSTVATMSSLMSASAAQQRFFMNITGAFGILALALAGVGIYGVMSYTVSRRTTEMGLRMALGASRGEVLSMIIGQGFRLTVAGIVLGLLLAYWATSFMSTVLFDVNPRDMLTFASAPVVLALIALAACLAPALRATRIDPIKALRVD